MYKLDLHTHSIISYDGGIDEEGFAQILASGILDVIAITDHNEITFAQKLRRKLGNRIIIGEEIDTTDGQIIGLFLEKKIAPGLSVQEVCRQIRTQEGVVYIPHPFEQKRWSMQKAMLEKIRADIDIIEVFNARGFLRGIPHDAMDFAKKHMLAMAAGSDAHGASGIGSAYNTVKAIPTSKTLPQLIRDAHFEKRYAPMMSLLTPRFNRLRKKLGKHYHDL